MVRPEDRLFALADPFWRSARRRFPQILLACLLLHLTVLLFLFLADQPDKDIAPPEKEIPVQIVIQPPPPPPPPPPKPEQKKPEQPKPNRRNMSGRRNPPSMRRVLRNQETIKRQALDDQTRAPVMAKPAPANDTKPTQQALKPAQNAAPEAAQQTTSPEEQKDDKDAEALSKAAPIRTRRPPCGCGRRSAVRRCRTTSVAPWRANSRR